MAEIIAREVTVMGLCGTCLHTLCVSLHLLDQHLHQVFQISNLNIDLETTKEAVYTLPMVRGLAYDPSASSTVTGNAWIES